MSDQIWSRQFYKALEAVGRLTDVEKVRLANILIVVSDVKKELVTLSCEFKHTLSVEDLPKHSCGSELYNVPSLPKKP